MRRLTTRLAASISRARICLLGGYEWAESRKNLSAYEARAQNEEHAEHK